MRGRFSTPFAVVLLALSATVALAQTAFSDFPISGQISAFQVNQGYSNSDSFTLATPATVSKIVFGAWVLPGDSVTGVTWAIGTAPFDTSLGTGTAATTSVYDSTNVDGFDVHTVTFTIPTANLAAGTYYLTLSNATSADGLPNSVSWDINDATGVDAWNSSYGHVSAAGTCFAQIGISGSCAESFQLLSAGAGTTATLTSPLAFPNTPSGTTSSALAATLSNTGATSLSNIVPTITGTNPSDFAISTGANACGASLAAGSSCSIYVTFTPASAASFSATLSVADSATGSPQTSSLTGTGTASNATLSSPVAFPNTPKGTTSAALAATLTNTGNGALNNIVPTITGTNPSDFAISTGANACGATLAASSSCFIYVTFTPASATSFSATLSVADSAAGSPQTSSLTGTGTAPAASLTPSLPFPNTTSGSTSAALAATLSNTGNGVLNNIVPTITGTNPSDFAISTGANACGASLAAGSSCSIYVTFTPASAASFSATLSVADSATGSPQTSSLTGTGISATTTATLTSVVTFPNTVVHVTSSALAATLTNTGTSSLTGIVPVITGINPDDFAITTGANACGASLAAGASCSIYVTFTPSGVASFSATLSVADSATGSPQIGYVLGTGIAPANSASLTSVVTFPNTVVHVTSSALAATLTNTGSNTVTGIAPVITGINPDDFAISTGPNACGASLAAGASCSIYVTFTPSAAVSFSATLSVADSATGSPQIGYVLGTGIAPANSVSLTSVVTFPNTTAHTTSAALAATLTNTGSNTVTGIAPSIGGPNPDDFAITTGANACGASLAAGASCSIYVTFTPSAAVDFSAALSVADSATGSPQIGYLLGTGK